MFLDDGLVKLILYHACSKGDTSRMSLSSFCTCFWREMYPDSIQLYLSRVTGKEWDASPVCNWARKGSGIYVLKYFLVSSYTCSLALLWLCFLSVFYRHRNETSHILKHQHISSQHSWLLILHFTSNAAAFFPAAVMSLSRISQKCSNFVLLGCIFNSPNTFTLLYFHICV